MDFGNANERQGEQQPAPAADKSFLDKAIDSWWGKVLLGAFIIFGTFVVYSDFTKLEDGEVESIWTTRRLAAIYDVCGKWPMVGLLGVIGVGTAGWGVRQLATGKE